MARRFNYNGMVLTDPDPSLTPEQVKEIYSAQYAELTNAAVTGPTKEGDDQVFKFSRAVGAKG